MVVSFYFIFLGGGGGGGHKKNEKEYKDENEASYFHVQGAR